ncbi:hypothetical protein [Reinekea sp. G2M2-21]|uniref:hypothetical protein n=1 Tax=Reinekea sp. G2M2-21 TaxID=2788942 RepID=UPI0018A97B9F|nr:hypothetical protein [Reinekea sp. G2M2-21]
MNDLLTQRINAQLVAHLEELEQMVSDYNDREWVASVSCLPAIEESTVEAA